MTLTNYSPFELQLDKILNDTLRAVSGRNWAPACNVFEDDQGITMQLALPGMDPKSVEVVAEDGVLTVRGERAQDATEGRTYLVREMSWGPFSRSFTIPTNVDHEKASASYKDGVLSIHLPKREEAKPRRISIEAA